MLVLFETAAGFAVFKLLDEKKLKEVDNLFEDFETPEAASKVVQLQNFKKFEDSAEALQAGVALNEGKICKPLKKLLKKVFTDEVQEQLMVWDAKLGNTIKEKLGVQCISNNNVNELMRCIKSQVEGLIPGLQEKELSAMSLGLGHNLARYKLKFSPDKVDTMIVQAICLLDDIDKELNNYVMRAREWYGWHFPELGKILTDNQAYIRTVMAMGTREKAVATDFSDFLSEDLEEKVKEAAEVSMGTEVADDDMLNINSLCEQILELTEYRAQLFEYLKNRMAAIAPNLTILVGELVGARLISHAGSLINLAKHPASTIQILGAEKALFRALKTRNSTPKYGLLYHAQLVSQISAKNKGKMSRMLAAKAALACRYDALGEETTTEMGIENHSKLSSRMSMLETGYSRKLSGKAKSQSAFASYHGTSDVRQYHIAADTTMESSTKRKFDDSYGEQKAKRIKVEEVEEAAAPEEPKSEKKKKKKKHQEEAAAEEEPVAEEVTEPVAEEVTEKKKKKKDKKGREKNVVDEEVKDVNLESDAGLTSKKPCLSVGTGFVWDVPDSLADRGQSSESEEEEEDEAKKKKTKKMTKAEREAMAKQEEQRLHELERARLDKDRLPQTAMDYEELLQTSPNSSAVWIQFISYHLESAEVEKAKAVARRALQVINMREEQERLNIWTVILRLEVLYGTAESVQASYREALATNDEQQVHLAMAMVYAENDKIKDASNIYYIMTKKFGQVLDVWVKAGIFFFRNKKFDEARKYMDRALIALDKKHHVELINRFGQLEFRFGEAERGRTMFESLLSNYPKRIDIWSVYVDLLTKNGDIEGARTVLERMTGLKLKIRKMRGIFKKFLDFEKTHGTPQRVQAVKKQVEDFVAAAISKE
ncbi:nucleolar protein 58-like [Penaeus monodon]|uniref:nucleolar protein 58-like n=1 Tax=Penaeus monodon TaxID=6687 RepID=UPI0018A6F740|nr:nucleolar protein 58-like [Penaeus monodon]